MFINLDKQQLPVYKHLIMFEGLIQFSGRKAILEWPCY